MLGNEPISTHPYMLLSTTAYLTPEQAATFKPEVVHDRRLPFTNAEIDYMERHGYPW